MSALVRHLREALRDPFADPVTIDGCRIARRLARRFERELAASAEKARLARAELNQISAAGSSTAGDADRCEGRAPEGPIRSAADEAGEEPVNARQPQGASGGVEEAGAATRTAYRIDPPRPVDFKRLAAAFRSKSAPPAMRTRKLQPALSREECARCGIPGWKGCEHQAPCEDQLIQGRAEWASEKGRTRTAGTTQT